MANAVPSISCLTSACSISREISPAFASTAGKSAAGNVDRVKRLRPAFTVALPPSMENSILEPSGKDLQISTSLRAGTVTSPSTPGASRSKRPTSSTSKSVPVKDSLEPSSAISTLERIGNVWRLSTTPATKLSGLISVSRAIENFMSLSSGYGAIKGHR